MKLAHAFLSSAVLAAGLLSALPAAAEVSVTTGAGYATMVKALAAAYDEALPAGAPKAVQNYGGNIGQMLSQVSAGSGVNLVITDLGTLKAVRTPVEFASVTELGSTPLVFVWGRSVKISGVRDLSSDAVKAFAYPDPKAAVYGRAAKAWLESSGLAGKLAGKALSVATVPQVAAYVVKGEVEAGFVNRTAARANAGSLDGVEEITSGYPPITMVAAVVKGAESDADVKRFVEFLGTDKARAILGKFGID